jgi:Tfp pilus assembly protein FimT
MCSKRKKREAGISLTEILVVLGILAILGFVSGTWLFSHAGRADLKRATRNLVSAFHTARTEAVKRNSPIEVRITDTGWSVVLRVDNSTLRTFSLADFRTPITVAPQKTYQFTGKGRPDGVINDTINITAAGNTMAVKLGPSGSVRVE